MIIGGVQVTDPKRVKRIMDAAGLACASPNAHLKPVAPKKESPLEEKFVALWKSLNGPELEREVFLVPGRKYRVDFLHRPSRIAFELEGFKDHASIKGFRRDAEKYLAIYFEGYQVVSLIGSLVTEENLGKLIGRVRA